MGIFSRGVSGTMQGLSNSDSSLIQTEGMLMSDGNIYSYILADTWFRLAWWGAPQVTTGPDFFI